ELEVPVIALSQLSRLVEQRAGKPVLSDLRESGSLEQDADIVLFLYRDSKKEEEEKETVTTEVIIAKHRNGPTGSIKLAFEKKINAFYNIAEGDISQGD
ncbi:MAG: DnaB-like helicase C-terminal domain-containing protein, partial [Erysipelotrichaceae bacterium]